MTSTAISFVVSLETPGRRGSDNLSDASREVNYTVPKSCGCTRIKNQNRRVSYESRTTPEEGRALAIAMARHMIHNIQPDRDVLKDDRPKYGANPDSLIAASQVVAIEFQTAKAVAENGLGRGASLSLRR